MKPEGMTRALFIQILITEVKASDLAPPTILYTPSPDLITKLKWIESDSKSDAFFSLKILTINRSLSFHYPQNTSSSGSKALSTRLR